MGVVPLPPGFRFHPTDEELIVYYLNRKINGHNIELEIIPKVDLYKCEPWGLTRYIVETISDGSKLGIEPFSVEVSPNGDLLVLDAESSNIYKISMPLSMYSRPKLVVGLSEGYLGHVDGKPREAKMNHPKGLAVDDSGNIYFLRS